MEVRKKGRGEAGVRPGMGAGGGRGTAGRPWGREGDGWE